MTKEMKIAVRIITALAAILSLFLLISVIRSNRDLQVADKRPAPLSDRLKTQAERYNTEAERLYKEGGPQNFQKALEKYQIAVETWDNAGQPNEKAHSLLKMGNIYLLLGDLKQSLNHLHQSLALYQQSNNIRGQVDVLNDLTLVYLQRGEREKAQESCLRTLHLSQSIAYKAGQAQSLVNQGKINNVLEKPETSLNLLTDALKIWIELGDEEKQASTYLEIGASYYYLGQYRDAINSRSQALILFQKIKDIRGQARALTLLGHLYSTIGDKQEALRHYRMASPLIEKAGNRLTESSLASGMSFVYTELGETQKALEHRKQALEIVRLIGDRENESACLMHIGELHQLLGQYKQAISHLQQARNVAQAIKDRRMEAQVLQSLGVVYQSLKAPKTAMRYYQQAIALYPQSYSSRWKAYAYNSIGEIYAQEGNLQKATAHYQQALEYNLAAEDRFGESQTRYHLARTFCDKGNWSEAIAESEKAVALIESLRAKVFSQNLRTSYFATVNQIYALYIDILMQQHRERPQGGFAAEALGVSERARARSLLDLLNESRYDIKQGADSKLLEQEHSLRQTLNGKADRKLQLTNQTGKETELAAVTKEVDDLTAQLDDVRSKIRETSPRYASLTQPQPLKAAEIQQLLDDNTMLLEYALGDERSYLWAVTRDSLEAFTLPSRAKIEPLVREVVQLMTAPLQQDGETAAEWQRRTAQADQQYWPRAAALSQMVLGPVAEKLSHKRLLIVGDGALQLLPFAALPAPVVSSQLSVTSKEANRQPTTDNRQPLIADHEITSLPSASSLKLLRQDRVKPLPPSGWLARWRSWWRQKEELASLHAVAVLADPVFEKDDKRVLGKEPTAAQAHQPQTRDVDLSDENVFLPRLIATREEAEEIQKAAGAHPFLLKHGFEVNRALLASEELNRYGVVHFATHGLWDSNNPELSAIFLSRFDRQGNKLDGTLRLSDIYNLTLPKELVVLSACETAVGKDIRGEGLIALTRGFMYAGAARVLASLWKVEDAATAEMMKLFYQHLLQDKMSPAAALRQAQIAMWQKEPTKAPYNWAAFVLQGEYR
jgi:CHAT domain-containing protein/predicted negative regulator of RcsB-dependent stress response